MAFSAVIVVRNTATGAGVRYAMPAATLARLGAWNTALDERRRFDAVMGADEVFKVGAPTSSG